MTPHGAGRGRAGRRHGGGGAGRGRVRGGEGVMHGLYYISNTVRGASIVLARETADMAPVQDGGPLVASPVAA